MKDDEPPKETGKNKAKLNSIFDYEDSDEEKLQENMMDRMTGAQAVVQEETKQQQYQPPPKAKQGGLFKMEDDDDDEEDSGFMFVAGAAKKQ